MPPVCGTAAMCLLAGRFLSLSEGDDFMGNYVLENADLRGYCVESWRRAFIDLRCKKQQEYLWNGDERYWPRRVPVLFPFVGLLKNRQYSYAGKNYSMVQHGFARDMEFECISQGEKACGFVCVLMRKR